MSCPGGVCVGGVSFALWCLMKSPLIIGTDVQALPAASLSILQNARLIAVNQDDLAMQGTLRVTFDDGGTRAPTVKVKPVVSEAACHDVTIGEQVWMARVGPFHVLWGFRLHGMLDF